MTEFDFSHTEAIHQLHFLDKKATKEHDIKGLIALFTDDCILIPPWGEPVSGHNEIQKFLEIQFGERKNFKSNECIQQFKEVRIFDGWAYEWGTIDGIFHFMTGGPDIFDRSRVFRILRLQPDGSWKVARVIWQYL